MKNELRGCQKASLGLLQADFAVEHAEDFGHGINEATTAFGRLEIFGGVYRLAFGKCDLGEQDGFILGFFVSRSAFGLQRWQLGAILFDGALDAVGVEGGAPQFSEGFVESVTFQGFEEDVETPFQRRLW